MYETVLLLLSVVFLTLLNAVHRNTNSLSTAPRWSWMLASTWRGFWVRCRYIKQHHWNLSVRFLTRQQTTWVTVIHGAIVCRQNKIFKPPARLM